MSTSPAFEPWQVPREWVGERAFVLCGGASLIAQQPLIPRLNGRIIAVKQAVRLVPMADVMFIAGEMAWMICAPCFPLFEGRYIVTRGRGDARFPERTKVIGRTPDPGTFSRDTSMVGGYDAGTSAINLAALFGSTEIIVLGYDMRGGHWDPAHPLPRPPQVHFDRHLSALPGFSAGAHAAGVRIVNVSPISAESVFERGQLEAFL